MKPYIHKVQYYETDKMGITHHSNYIRWMEEARTYFLAELGMGYDKLEEMGVVSPVIAIECKYVHTSTFPDIIMVRMKLSEFKGVKLKISYDMTNEAGEKVFEAKSEHCFLDKNGHPVRVSREFPELYERMMSIIDVDVME